MSILSPESTRNLSSATLDKLQDLLKVNIDSETGFRDAGEHVQDVALRRIFRQFADERQSNAAELKQFVELNGETAVKEGSVMAAMHRTWMDLKAALTSNDAKAVLNEAERGEDHILHMYEDVLKESAGSAVNDVLQHQYAKVKAAHDVVRDLRDAENAAS
ncbi:MAG: PA2169 family four-helix-bundle protein [Bythopirellula sp.]|nr:PA2169 family four-helix-bundle protein [Bythopirellula sp.]